MLLREDVWPVTSHVGVDDAGVHVVDDDVGAVVLVEALLLDPGANCTKLDLLGKSILGDYFKESRTSKRPFLLLRISFPGRPIFIQFVPGFALKEYEESRSPFMVMKGIGVTLVER